MGHPDPGSPSKVDTAPIELLLGLERQPRLVGVHSHLTPLAQPGSPAFDGTVGHREAPDAFEPSARLLVHERLSWGDRTETMRLELKKLRAATRLISAAYSTTPPPACRASGAN
jgi:hypothetical protein